TLVAQKSLRNLAKRSVRLDAYIEGVEDRVYNIEIQRSDNCNHVKRVRYNASTITINKSGLGDEFEDVQDVIVIYISEFDMFGEGKTVYHVENVIRETGNSVNDGLMSVYVNTEVADDSLISDLMQCFLKTDFEDDKFPNISRRMKELKHGEEDEKMCKSVEEYAERKAKEVAQKAAKEAAQKAAKKATEEAVKKAMAEKKKTVEKLNDMGMDISLIASAVDMDEETIKQWLEK
uniref:Rpn family recombination-promoting nuclease/putative transposase n=1 Tax=Butyribacter intestini TaxID=1703332 RepID=UPI0022E180EC